MGVEESAMMLFQKNLVKPEYLPADGPVLIIFQILPMNQQIRFFPVTGHRIDAWHRLLHDGVR